MTVLQYIFVFLFLKFIYYEIRKYISTIERAAFIWNFPIVVLFITVSLKMISVSFRTVNGKEEHLGKKEVSKKSDKVLARWLIFCRPIIFLTFFSPIFFSLNRAILSSKSRDQNGRISLVEILSCWSRMDQEKSWNLLKLRKHSVSGEITRG